MEHNVNNKYSTDMKNELTLHDKPAIMVGLAFRFRAVAVQKMNQMDNKEECKHNNTSWSALHDCHFCNDCQRWVDYDYKLKEYRVYIDGKWVLDSERVLANER